MAQLPAQGEDTAMNMTPMIDICFQLIVFFMLTLKFKSIDKRFESLLPNRGQQARPAVLVPAAGCQQLVVQLGDVLRRDVSQWRCADRGDDPTLDRVLVTGPCRGLHLRAAERQH